MLSGKILWKRLIHDVCELYKQNRSHLSLADKDIFKLPLQYQIKQGNQHLLLWTKRANLTFDQYREIPIDTTQQQKITDWIRIWDSDDLVANADDTLCHPLTNMTQNYSKSNSQDPYKEKTQMDISCWLKSWGDTNDSEQRDSENKSPH
jgi:hypothetical protein